MKEYQESQMEKKQREREELIERYINFCDATYLCLVRVKCPVILAVS